AARPVDPGAWQKPDALDPGEGRIESRLFAAEQGKLRRRHKSNIARQKHMSHAEVAQMTPNRSHARVPFVAAIFPIPARRVVQEVHFGEVLDHLVAELDAGIQPKGRPASGCERPAVHAIGQDGLRVLGALAIPGGPVTDVERAKLDEARTWARAHALGELAH